MDGTKSREALLGFLDYLSKKGLINKATASARKAAVNKVLGILDDHDAEDISQIDLDELMMRFANLEGAKYTRESLQAYKSRVKSSIEDFLNYVENPLAFKPSTQYSGRKSAERKNKNENSESIKRDTTVQDQVRDRFVSPPKASVHVLPIPIRPEMTVYIQGLPYDLTPSEANKIANVIRAMAIEE